MAYAGASRLKSSYLCGIAILGLFASRTIGCNLSSTAVPSPSPLPDAHPIKGKLFGGQQPVVGASIQGYAVGAPATGGGYGVGSTALITGVPVLTDANGEFTITGDYTPPAAASHFYIVATGGNPGLGNALNPDLVLMSTVAPTRRRMGSLLHCSST